MEAQAGRLQVQGQPVLHSKISVKGREREKEGGRLGDFHQLVECLLSLQETLSLILSIPSMDQRI